MTAHTDLLARIRRELSHGDSRLWSNPVGTALAGKSFRIKDGSAVIRHPKRVTFGLERGSSDLIGLHTVTVTPDMVGQRLAVFVSIEGKAGRDTLRPEQANWLRMVSDMGGIAGVARSVDDAAAILAGDTLDTASEPDAP